jgi:hypothetical protein
MNLSFRATHGVSRPGAPHASTTASQPIRLGRRSRPHHRNDQSWASSDGVRPLANLTASVTGILRRFWIGESAGHLGSVLARATMRRRRILAIEFGTCRSGRIHDQVPANPTAEGHFYEPRNRSRVHAKSSSLMRVEISVIARNQFPVRPPKIPCSDASGIRP